jgi:hypothetical protein
MYFPPGVHLLDYAGPSQDVDVVRRRASHVATFVAYADHSTCILVTDKGVNMSIACTQVFQLPYKQVSVRLVMDVVSRVRRSAVPGPSPSPVVADGGLLALFCTFGLPVVVSLSLPPSLSLIVWLSVCLCACVSACLCVWLCVCVSVSVSVSVSICLAVCLCFLQLLSIYLGLARPAFVSLFLSLSLCCLCVCVSVCLCACVHVCPSMCLSVSVSVSVSVSPSLSRSGWLSLSLSFIFSPSLSVSLGVSFPEMCHGGHAAAPFLAQGRAGGVLPAAGEAAAPRVPVRLRRYRVQAGRRLAPRQPWQQCQ